MVGRAAIPSHEVGNDTATVSQQLGHPNSLAPPCFAAGCVRIIYMHVTAKADYAVRAVIELADSSPGSPAQGRRHRAAQSIPVSFLENILTQLRSAGVVRSQRGPEGGYWLRNPPPSSTSRR